MEENKPNDPKGTDGAGAQAAEQMPLGIPDPGAPAEKANGAAPGSSTMLEAAVEALERLTDTVETLGALADGDARIKIGELAAELRGLADRLSASAGAEQASPPPSEGNGNDLATVLESVRATLQRVSSLLDATKAAPPKKPKPGEGEDGEDGSEEDDPEGKKKKRDPTPTPGAAAAPPPQDDPLRKDLAGIVDSVKKLVEGLKDQALRLSKLEKRFGLPNSSPAREEGSGLDTEDVGWPMDLNRPFDRENVDKAVSFHDL